MRYLCAVHVDPALMAQLTETEHKALSAECQAYDQELMRSGHLVVAEALGRPQNAMIVRVRDKKVAVTDGPFIETKEHLGGFLYVEARDLNEAVEIAAGCPMARMGAIEVRPVLNFD
jgi:hypothetical protein